MPGPRGDLPRGGAPSAQCFHCLQRLASDPAAGTPNVSMVFVGDNADAADDWIAAHMVLAQLVEQRPCLFEVLGVEAFCKPAIDSGEEIVGFGPSTPLTP